jgi:hypothetical protein
LLPTSHGSFSYQALASATLQRSAPSAGHAQTMRMCAKTVMTKEEVRIILRV